MGQLKVLGNIVKTIESVNIITIDTINHTILLYDSITKVYSMHFYEVSNNDILVLTYSEYFNNKSDAIKFYYARLEAVLK